MLGSDDDDGPGIKTYGPELVINGDFTNPAGWTIGLNWSIVGGECIATNTGINTTTDRATAMRIGRRYRTIFTVRNYIGGLVAVALGNTGVGTNRNANGTYTQELVCSGTTRVYMVDREGAGSFTVDDVSVREIIWT